MRGPGGADRFAAYRFLFPSWLAVVGIAFFPAIAVFYWSLHRYLPAEGVFEPVGLAHFARLVADERLRQALWNTTYITTLSVALELGLGLALALLLHQRFPGRGLARAAVLVPWAIPTVVTARLWEWLWNADYGLVNHLLGLSANWLGHPGLAIHAVIVADVWKSTPFAALLLLAGLQVIPEDLDRAARTDGASPWRRLRHVTLPLLKPMILVVLLFRMLDAFRIFDVVYVLTGGGPANTTETLSVYAYKTFFRILDFGFGSAISVVVFLLVGAASVLYLRLWMARSASP
jgi:multiple sugar transport system permease protein